MLRESLNSTPKVEAKRRRPLVIAVLAGACCMALGFLGMQTVQHQPISDDAMHAHLTSLMDHQEYLKSQNAILGELIEEGVENQVAVVGSIAAIKVAATFAATKGPMIASVASTLKNVVWGEQVARKTVDPAKIDKSFDDSKKFSAEIKTRFPKSYGIVTGLRKDLKQHHFDLSALIQEVSLLSDSTANDANKTIKKLNLRQKFLDKGTYKEHPEKDVKIWQYAIKNQVTALNESIVKCDAIIVSLVQLQKDTAKTQDHLEKELDHIKKTLESSVKMQRVKMADLEQKLKATGCVNNSGELLRAIFTLGIACAFDNATKIKLQNVKAGLIEEEAILKAILKRMGYFDGLVDTAKALTTQASGLLESTKQFRATMRDTRDELVNDYTKGEIIENMGDVDFANDFAESLFKTLDTLKKECARVSADCIQRKHAMDKALAGLHEEEEEVIELAAADLTIFGTYEKTVNTYQQYFETVSADLNEAMNGWFAQSLNTVVAKGDLKNLLLLNVREEYGDLKNSAITVLDDIMNVQMALESVQQRIAANAVKPNRYISKKPDWKYQHKYAPRTIKGAITDEEKIAGLLKKLGKDFQEYPNILTKMSDAATETFADKIKTQGAKCKALTKSEPKPDFTDADVTEMFKEIPREVVGRLIKKVTGDDLTDEQQEILKKWHHRENMRRANLKICKKEFAEIKDQQDLITKTNTTLVQSFKGVKIAPFNAETTASAQKTLKELGALSKTSVTMEGTEQADTIARNTALAKSAKKSQSSAQSRQGETRDLKSASIA